MRILQLRIRRGILWLPAMCRISGVGRNIDSEDQMHKNERQGRHKDRRTSCAPNLFRRITMAPKVNMKVWAGIYSPLRENSLSFLNKVIN